MTDQITTSNKFTDAIGSVNEWIAKAMRFFLLGLVALVCIQVVARYVFNRPFIWSNEVDIYMFGILLMFTAGYTYKRDAHISVDILERLLPKRVMTIVRMFTYPLVFIFLGVMIWQGSLMAYKSMISAERFSSVWAPLAWPLKFALPIGALLFFLQAFSKLIGDIRFLAENKDKITEDEK